MKNNSSLPWYKTTYRWAQTNITEIDPIQYDIDWWRKQWKKTKVQGVIINAGGIITYYPSELPLSFKSPFLGERDLLGELVTAAREEGLIVLARMDSNRVDQQFYIEHPDWIAVDRNGKPYMDGDKYITCIHSPYYDEYLPQVLLEIGRKYDVDGFTDNSYSGLGQDSISYSRYAKARFMEDTGYNLPENHDWDAPVFQAWIRWSYKERIRIWDLNEQTVQHAFGKNCRWLGMFSGDVVSQNERFRDLVETCKRSDIIMLDYQSRKNPIGFKMNTESGKMLHELAGWDILIPESLALYQHAEVAFRLAAKPAAESTYWAYSGFAGGIQPWWHHVGAYHHDRRAYKTPVPIFDWHEKNIKYLVDREIVAPVGVVYSTTSIDFYGRDDKYLRFTCPFEGIVSVLSESHIPYRSLHISMIPETPVVIKLLIFPNLGSLSYLEIERIKRYVANGGSVICTGETGAYDEVGKPRNRYPFEDVFGISYTYSHHGTEKPVKNTWHSWEQHSYVRLHPENRGMVDGPKVEDEPKANKSRHEVLDSFDETDILAFGGRIECIASTDDTNVVPLTFVPSFPVYPPEISWMKYPDSTLPALVMRQNKGLGRLVYMPADFDRQYFLHRLPDHRMLLKNIFQWALQDTTISLEYEGEYDIDCNFYKQGDHYILHLVNLTGTDKAIVTTFVPIGPVKVTIKTDLEGSVEVTKLVEENTITAKNKSGYLEFQLDRIDYHEVCVLASKK